jgi:Tfp pilus assembly protein PilE
MKLKVSISKRIKVNKGITLIALVVTIVVLLILAGITIASVTGEKGIIKEARTAKELSEKAALEELVELAIIKAEQKHRNPTIDNVIEELKNNKVISKDDQVNKETGSIVTDAGYEITGKLDDYIGKVSVGDNNNTTGGNASQGGNLTGGGNTEEPPKPTLPSTDDTKPYLPDDNSTIISNNPDTGIIVKDSNNNEWVWIEVPKSIYADATYNGGTVLTSSEDYAKIESTMQAYASTYRGSYTDTFYSTAQHGFADATEYNNWKNSMLKSVYENGGFYIGRYEVGTETARFASSDALTTPLIQRDKYPYNFVTCSQAQTLAKQLAIGGKRASLMFGIQWDLVMKFIEEKGAKTQDELKKDSSSWGNYYNVSFDIKREQGLYTTSPYTSGSWNTTSNYTKPISAVLLTTGATDRNSALGIYDLAGNVEEWTLEYTNSTRFLCAVRGLGYRNASSIYPVFDRGTGSPTNSDNYIGVRSALW